MSLNPSQRIGWLESETASRNRDVQDGSIPYFSTENITRVFDYHFNGKRMKNKFHELVFETDRIRFLLTPKYMNRPVEGSVPTLVRLKVIQPFILWLNGRMVKWSDIKIKFDGRATFMCITGRDYIRDVVYYPDILQLPFNVKYTETNETVDSKYVEIFRFNELGNLDISGDIVVYMNPYSDIQFLSVDTNEDLINQTMPVPIEHKLKPENFLIFKDGLLYHDYTLHVNPLNIITMGFGVIQYVATYKIFYANCVEWKHDNVYHLGDNTEYLQDYATKELNKARRLPEVFNKEFDFDRDPEKSDYTNMVESTDYISRYNSQLLEQDPETIADIVVKSGKEIKDMIDDQHYVHMVRYTARPMDNSVMIFKNGLLYNRSDTVRYKLHQFYFKAYPQFIEDDDVFEFIFYKNILNTVLENIPIDENGYIPYVESTLPAANITILSDDHDNNRYTVKDSGYAYYSIPFTVEGDKLKVEDEYYHGKTVTIVTKNHFEYARYTMSNTSNRIYLGGTFKYYYEHANYMVFVNGRKMNPGFGIVRPTPDSPVHGTTIYLELEYEAGDYVDVFYLPEGIKMDMLKPTYNLVRRVYTYPNVMQYKIPVPYDDFFKDKNSVDITNEYGAPIKNMEVDYTNKTVTFLGYSRIELAFQFKFDEFMSRIKNMMSATTDAFRNIDSNEIVAADEFYYTDDIDVIESAHNLVNEFFGNERAGILRLFHRMVDDAYNGPALIEWALRKNLADQFDYIRVSDKLPIFMEAIDEIMDFEHCAYKSWDDTELGVDDIYYTTDPEVLARAHALVNECFEYESDSILTLFHKMVDNAFETPSQIEWSLRKGLPEMFLDPMEDQVVYRDLIDKLNMFIGRVDRYFVYEEQVFERWDDSERGIDKIYYTTDPGLIEKAHQWVEEDFEGQPTRILDILHKMVDDAYMEPNLTEWSLREHLPEMFIYIAVNNRIDDWIEHIYQITRSRYNAELDDVVLYERSPLIKKQLHDSVDEWFGEEPKYIIDLFHRMVEESFRKPSNLRLSLRFKLSSMFNILPYVIVFYFRYRGNDLGVFGNGYIRIRRHEAPIGISPQTVLVWINGKKVLQSDLMRISSSLMKVTKDVQSLQNLNVVRIANPEDWPIDVSQYKSEHDLFMISTLGADLDHINAMHGTYNGISDTEEEMIYDIEPEMIYNGVILDFYMDQESVDADPFLYKYEDKDYFDKDGVYISTVLDNDRRANIPDDNGLMNN